MSRALPEAWPLGLDVNQASTFVGVGKTLFLELVDDDKLPKPIELAPQTLRWDRDELADAFKALKGKRQRKKAWGNAA